MGKASRRIGPNRGLHKQSSSSSCSIPVPVLLSIAEKSTAMLHELEEKMAANNNGMVHDCQSSPDDNPNLEDVLSDEEDEEPSDTTIPTIEPTLHYGGLSFLHNDFLLDHVSCGRAENAHNNEDTTNPTQLLIKQVIQLLKDTNDKTVTTAKQLRKRQKKIEQKWQRILASTSFKDRANISDTITKVTRLLVLLHWATPACMDNTEGPNRIDIKQGVISLSRGVSLVLLIMRRGTDIHSREDCSARLPSRPKQ